MTVASSMVGRVGYYGASACSWMIARSDMCTHPVQFKVVCRESECEAQYQVNAVEFFKQ